jgi:hypothetical protein
MSNPENAAQNDAVVIAERTCAHFVARALEQGLKGKARDRAAVEFMTGAAAYAAAAHGTDSVQWRTMSIAAFMTASRGYAYIAEKVKS